MAKRGRLEVIKGILEIVKDSHNSILATPLLRKTGLSSARFKEYYLELLAKGFVAEIAGRKGQKHVTLTDKGFKYLEKYKMILGFIDEFEL